MGVEYSIYCKTCKVHADLHKVYAFAGLFYHKNYDESFDDGGPKTNLNDYWSQKGFVFLLDHWGHDVNLTSDHDDDCYDKLTHLTEVMKDWQKK